MVTDSTDCKISSRATWANGNRCHLPLARVMPLGSMPEKGDNAVYKIAKVVREIEELNTRLKGDEFLGKGTITVSYIDCKTPSLSPCTGQAYIHL